MTQILPENPSFGQLMGRSLGQGLSAGISKSGDLATQMALERGKLAQKQRSIGEVLGMSQSQQSPTEAEFLKSSENSGVPPEVGKQLWDSYQQQSQQQSPLQNLTPEKIMKVAQIDPQMGNTLAQLYQSQQREDTKREMTAEKPLLEKEEALKNLEQEELRFNRLEDLFSPQNESKFPPAGLVGLFSKNGEINPIAQSQLSPEAQEATKLIVDNIAGARNTFGSRVTNFDVQTYMKKLPQLINTAEGRRRVLRDLKIMNQLNQLYDRGVLEMVDRFGGPRKISLTKAESMFRKDPKYAAQVKDLKEQFVNPKKDTFSSIPSVQLYPKGTELLDEDTGKTFVNNGTEWVPK